MLKRLFLDICVLPRYAHVRPASFDGLIRSVILPYCGRLQFILFSLLATTTTTPADPVALCGKGAFFLYLFRRAFRTAFLTFNRHLHMYVFALVTQFSCFSQSFPFLSKHSTCHAIKSTIVAISVIRVLLSTTYFIRNVFKKTIL